MNRNHLSLSLQVLIIGNQSKSNSSRTSHAVSIALDSQLNDAKVTGKGGGNYRKRRKRKKRRK